MWIKPHYLPIRGTNSIAVITIQASGGNSSIFALEDGIISYIDRDKSLIVVKSKDTKIRYLGLVLDGHFVVGQEINCGEILGNVDTDMGYLRINPDKNLAKLKLQIKASCQSKEERN